MIAGLLIVIKFLLNWIKNVLVGALTHPLASANFMLCALGGFAATGTSIGEWIGKITNFFLPWWGPHALFVVGTIAIVCDVAREGIAERFANYGALLVPSFGMAIPHDAKLYTTLAAWISDVSDWLDKYIGVWIGGSHVDATLTVTAVLAIFICLWYHEWFSAGRTIGNTFRKGGGTSASTSTSTASGSGPRVTRRSASRTNA